MKRVDRATVATLLSLAVTVTLAWQILRPTVDPYTLGLIVLGCVLTVLSMAGWQEMRARQETRPAIVLRRRIARVLFLYENHETDQAGAARVFIDVAAHKYLKDEDIIGLYEIAEFRPWASIPEDLVETLKEAELRPGLSVREAEVLSEVLAPE